MLIGLHGVKNCFNDWSCKSMLGFVDLTISFSSRNFRPDPCWGIAGQQMDSWSKTKWFKHSAHSSPRHIAVACISCMHLALYVWLGGRNVRILYKTFEKYVELCKSYVSSNMILKIKIDAEMEPRSFRIHPQIAKWHPNDFKMTTKCSPGGLQMGQGASR